MQKNEEGQNSCCNVRV